MGRTLGRTDGVTEAEVEELAIGQQNSSGEKREGSRDINHEAMIARKTYGRT